MRAMESRTMADLSGRSAVEAWWTRALSADDKAAAKSWVARNYV